MKKPPLGVIHERIHEEERIQELARAIHEHVLSGHIVENAGMIKAWVNELHKRFNGIFPNLMRERTVEKRRAFNNPPFSTENDVEKFCIEITGEFENGKTETGPKKNKI